MHTIIPCDHTQGITNHHFLSQSFLVTAKWTSVQSHKIPATGMNYSTLLLVHLHPYNNHISSNDLVMRSRLPLMLHTMYTLPVFPHCHPTVLPHTSDQNTSATNTRIHTHSLTHHFHIQANAIFAHRLLCYYDTLSFADNAKTAGS